MTHAKAAEMVRSITSELSIMGNLINLIMPIHQEDYEMYLAKIRTEVFNKTLPLIDECTSSTDLINVIREHLFYSVQYSGLLNIEEIEDKLIQIKSNIDNAAIDCLSNYSDGDTEEQL